MSWSKHWDDLVAAGDRDAVRTGREIEVRTLSLVLFPDRIQAAWDAGEFGQLGYLAEALATWPDQGMVAADPVLRRNVAIGLAQARRAGWPERLDSGWLFELEGLLNSVLDTQRAEGFVLSTGEVAEVRRRLARQHLQPPYGFDPYTPAGQRALDAAIEAALPPDDRAARALELAALCRDLGKARLT